MADGWPAKIKYPILYKSGGDTTAQAVLKLMNEFDAVYGRLNGLHESMLTTEDLKKAIDNFKNNLTFNDIKGTIDLSRTTGTLPFDRITGNVPGSRVVGDLTNATISASKVTGLVSFLQNDSTFKAWINKLIEDAINNNAGSDFPVGFTMPVMTLPIAVPGDSASRWDASITAKISYGSWPNQQIFYNTTYRTTLSGGTTVDKAAYIRGFSGYAQSTTGTNVSVPRDRLLDELNKVDIEIGSYSYVNTGSDHTGNDDGNDREVWEWKRSSNDSYIKRVS